MPVTFYRVFIRPTTDVAFPEDPAEFVQYVLDTYVATGACTEFRTATYSDDNLIKTIKSVWIDQTAVDAALLDPKWDENADFLSRYSTPLNIIVHNWIE
jgi:hypothetical protein